MAKAEKKPTTLRTASIKVEADDAACAALTALQSAYADACNLLVPTIVKTRCWNRFKLHTLTYSRLRAETPLGSQHCCNVLRSVTAAYKALKCGSRAHSDVNAARNHARLGERALSPRGEVNRPNVGEISHALSL